MTLERISAHTANSGATTRTAQRIPLLALPGVRDGWRYDAAYWSGTIGRLVAMHHLRAARVRPCAAMAHVTPASRAEWQVLYGDAPSTASVPYTYAQGVGTLLYTRIFRDIGLNLRHLLHVQHQTSHYVPVHEWVDAEHQELHGSLRGAWRIGGDRALIATRIAMYRPRDEGGALLATVNDRFIVRHVPADDLATLVQGRTLLRNIAAFHRSRPTLDRTTDGTRTASIPLPPDLGRRFGRVSGDRHPMHTTALAARLCGMARPFLQGLGLRNAVIRELARAGYPLTRFQLSFTRPALLGQTLTLVMQGREFEVVDEAMRVVSFGSASDDA